MMEKTVQILDRIIDDTWRRSLEHRPEAAAMDTIAGRLQGLRRLLEVERDGNGSAGPGPVILHTTQGVVILSAPPGHNGHNGSGHKEPEPVAPSSSSATEAPAPVTSQSTTPPAAAPIAQDAPQPFRGTISDYRREYGAVEGFRLWEQATTAYLDAHPEIESEFHQQEQYSNWMEQA